MIHTIDPEIKQSRLDLIDGFVYSVVDAPIKGEKIELKMMLMKESFIGKPRGFKAPAKPCILWVMGGAWRECPREKCIPFLVSFARAGYVVASASYRTTGEAVWPAQIKDVMTAIRYLRANAEKFGIDPEKIAVMGLSAGGHLTAMAAMNPTEYGGEEWSEFSSEIQVAVDMFGPTDLENLVNDKDDSVVPARSAMPGLSMEEKLIGCIREENIEGYRDANPINHVSEAACPILIMHGKIDAQVPVKQSIRLYEALEAIGKEPEMYLLENTGHGYHQFFQEDVKQIMIDFLDKYLK